MPTYSYKCLDCGTKEDFITRYDCRIFTVMCKKCEKQTSHTRTFSPSGAFILRGKGWAKDNYNK